MNIASIVVAGASAGAMFTIALLALLAFKALSHWMHKLEQRDRDRAEAEGLAAFRRGARASENPYVGENADRFRAMAQAWTNGYVKGECSQSSIVQPFSTNPPT